MNQQVHALNRKEETGSITDKPFSLALLVRAIKRAKPTSPGKDQVCYVMLKQLGEESLLKLLEVLNKVWKEGKLPVARKEALIVIPIRKSGKDPNKLTSYGPAALTSILCKIMERMITERLSFEMEKKKITGKLSEWFYEGKKNNGFSSKVRD